MRKLVERTAHPNLNVMVERESFGFGKLFLVKGIIMNNVNFDVKWRKFSACTRAASLRFVFFKKYLNYEELFKASENSFTK